MDILLCPEKKTRSDVPKRDWPRISQNLWIRSVELWCWRRLLRVPWTARRSNQSILKEISPEYSSEGLMLRMKLQYFGHLMRRVSSLENTLMLGELKAGGERDDRGWDGWMASPVQWTWVWTDSRRWWRTGKPHVLQSVGSQRVRCDWSDWFTATMNDKWSEWGEVARACPTLCDPVDCSPPGSSIHGILQARILEWVAISFPRGPSWPRDWTQVSRIAGRGFNLWTTREANEW